MLIGKTIGGRYKISNLVAEGGMAHVYKAYDEVLKRDVAIKVLKSEMSKEEDSVEKFRGEVNVILRLSHPNIRQVYDYFEEEGLICIAMEYVEGKTLKELIKSKGRLTPKEAVNISKELASAIYHANQNGVIHRDIKPQNILIDDQGTVKVMDFGIALLNDVSQVTKTSVAMGSVHYISPEQAKGENVDERTDIYAMGIVLYEMLTGEVPFKGKKIIDIAMKHLKEEIPSVRDFDKEIPQALENVILRATSKKKEYRHLTADDFLIDVRTALSAQRSNEKPLIYINLAKDEAGATKDLEQTMKVDSENLKRELNKQTRTKENYEDEEQKSGFLAKLTKRQKTMLFGGIGIGILIILIIFLFGSKPQVLPQLKNKSCDDAFETLADMGLDVEAITVETEYVVGEEGCKVVETTPNARSEFKSEEDITIYTQVGEQGVILENYVGQNIDSVKASLEANGIVVVVQYIEDEDAKEGEIISQNPGSGVAIKAGESVLFEVAKEAALKEYIVPDYKQYDINYFRSWVSGKNIKLSETGQECPDTNTVGDVLSTSPGPDSTIKEGETLKITFCESIEIPQTPPPFSVEKNDRFKKRT